MLEAAARAEAVFALADLEPLLRRVLEALEPEHALRPKLELYLGKLTTLTGRSEEAENLLAGVLEAARDTGDTPLEAGSRLALAQLFQRLSRWPEAIALLETNLSPKTPPAAWGALISCLRFSGRTDEALTYALEAERWMPSDPIWQAYLAQQRAAAYITLERLEEAHKYASDAVALSEQTHSPLSLSRSLITLGRIEHQRLQFDAGLRCYARARQAATQIGDLRGITTTEINAAAILIDAGELETASQRLEDGLVIAERGQYRDLVAVTHLNLADVRLQLGHFRAATMQAQAAVQDYRELGNGRMFSRAVMLLARAQAHDGIDPEASLALCEATTPAQQSTHTSIRVWWLLETNRADEALEVLYNVMGNTENLTEDLTEHMEVQLLLIEVSRTLEQYDWARKKLAELPRENKWASVIAALELALAQNAPDAGVLDTRVLTASGHADWAKRLARSSLLTA